MNSKFNQIQDNSQKVKDAFKAWKKNNMVRCHYIPGTTGFYAYGIANLSARSFKGISHL